MKTYIKPVLKDAPIESERLFAVSFGVDKDHGADAEESLAREDFAFDEEGERIRDYCVWEKGW